MWSGGQRVFQCLLPIRTLVWSPVAWRLLRNQWEGKGERRRERQITAGLFCSSQCVFKALPGPEGGIERGFSCSPTLCPGSSWREGRHKARPRPLRFSSEYVGVPVRYKGRLSTDFVVSDLQTDFPQQCHDIWVNISIWRPKYSTHTQSESTHSIRTHKESTLEIKSAVYAGATRRFCVFSQNMHKQTGQV